MIFFPFFLSKIYLAIKFQGSNYLSETNYSGLTFALWTWTKIFVQANVMIFLLHSISHYYLEVKLPTTHLRYCGSSIYLRWCRSGSRTWRSTCCRSSEPSRSAYSWQSRGCPCSRPPPRDRHHHHHHRHRHHHHNHHQVGVVLAVVLHQGTKIKTMIIDITDPSRWSSTNRQNSPIQQNHRNHWANTANTAILIPPKIWNLWKSI